MLANVLRTPGTRPRMTSARAAIRHTAHMTSRSRRAAALLVSLLTFALLPTASASAANDTGLVVTQLPAQVRLIPGESFTLSLSTNRTTGYSWSAKVGGKANAVAVSAGRYTAPQSPEGMVGVPGTTTWKIRATKPGTATVTILATPPGGGTAVDTDTQGRRQRLTVIVMPAR